MIKVLVVDDSAFSRKIITKILESIPDVHVVDTATDGQDAIKKTVRLRPDLITLDLEMPLMNGFSFLRWLMNNIPTPVIVVSSQEAHENVFRALDYGALDFVVKPVRRASIELEEIRADLINKVMATPLLAVGRLKERSGQLAAERTVSAQSIIPKEPPLLVAIAASTGGPPAMQSIIKALPANFEVPLFVAQHMPSGFTSLFAERLDKCTALTVMEASDGLHVRPQHVYIAPGGKHMTVEKEGAKFVVRIHPRAAYQARYIPSGNALFESLADQVESRCIAAILTGMGDDGKEGMVRVKEKGGTTIAESRSTAIIFGMPQEAIKAGVVDYVLPLPEIALALYRLTARTQRR